MLYLFWVVVLAIVALITIATVTKYEINEKKSEKK